MDGRWCLRSRRERSDSSRRVDVRRKSKCRRRRPRNTDGGDADRRFAFALDHVLDDHDVCAGLHAHWVADPDLLRAEEEAVVVRLRDSWLRLGRPRDAERVCTCRPRPLQQEWKRQLPSRRDRTVS